MSAEAGFLLSAIRGFLDPQVPLGESANIDWAVLFRLASCHAVTPMLCVALKGASLPPVALDLAGGDFQYSVRGSLLQTAELVRLVALLQDHGITPIALKGKVLSNYLYHDPAVRSSGDIDLLVRRGQVLQVRDLLVSGGYRLTGTLHWHSDSALFGSRENEIPFEDSDGCVRVDVHWRIMPSYFASPFDGMDIWPSSKTITLAGRQVETLGPDQLLLLLCSHGAKHQFERLGWICDIASLLAISPDLDWPAIMAQAARTHTSRQLWLGVQLAVDLLDAPRPPLMPEDPQVQAIARKVKDRLLAGAPTQTPARQLLGFPLGVFECPGHKLRFLAGQFLTPSEAEFQVLRLPPPLFFLYYLFRPVRLIAKTAFQLVRGTPQTAASGNGE